MRLLLRATALHTFLILMALLPGCAKPKQEQIVPGGTTTTVLKATMGEPAHVYVPTVRPQAKLLDYPDGCSFQVEHDVVVGVSCLPVGSEVTLQYWRHQWIGHSPQFEELPNTTNIHGQKRFQLASKQDGMAVIYDESSDSVLRVVRYEKH